MNNRSSVYQLHAASDGSSLFALITNNGIALSADCGGLGICGNCRVKILGGEVSAHHPDELEYLFADELASGIRLACRCQVTGEVTISIPQSGTAMQILETTADLDIKLDPPVKKQLLVLAPGPQESMFEALQRQTRGPIAYPLTLIREIAALPTTVTVVTMKDCIIGLEPGDTHARIYGMAVDIGTTTIVAELLELATGRTLSVASMVNPQFALGADVVSRIHYAGQDEQHLHKLASLLVNTLNEVIEQLCGAAAVDRQECYLITVAANAVMMHLLLGVNPAALGRYPYRTVFREALQLRAADLNIKAAPGAIVQCLPAISAFIGADISAGILVLDLKNAPGSTLFIDMGTNGEIVLAVNGNLIAASTAAGPALEGMNISCGMKAAAGAIDHVKLQDGQLVWTTIGNAPARGLCGSGLLDLVAALLQAGVIQKSGRINPPGSGCLAGIKEIGNSRCFELLPPAPHIPRGIYLSQQDIRQVQLAKGALAAGIKLLLQGSGLSENMVERVCLAGAFGSYLQINTLVTLGLFPDSWKDRVVYVGNSSLAGARLAAMDSELLERNRDVFFDVDYYDLNSCDNFSRIFTRAMSFNPY